MPQALTFSEALAEKQRERNANAFARAWRLATIRHEAATKARKALQQAQAAALAAQAPGSVDAPWIASGSTEAAVLDLAAHFADEDGRSEVTREDLYRARLTIRDAMRQQLQTR